MNTKTILVPGSSISNSIPNSGNLANLQELVKTIPRGNLRILATILEIKFSGCRHKIILSGFESPKMKNLFEQWANLISLPISLFDLEEEARSASTAENLQNLPYSSIDKVISDLVHLPRIHSLAILSGIKIVSLDSWENILANTHPSPENLNAIYQRTKSDKQIWREELNKLKKFNPDLASKYFNLYLSYLENKTTLQELISIMSK